MSYRNDILAALDSVAAYDASRSRNERSADYHKAKRERQTARRDARKASPRVQAFAAFEAEAR